MLSEHKYSCNSQKAHCLHYKDQPGNEILIEDIHSVSNIENKLGFILSIDSNTIKSSAWLHVSVQHYFKPECPHDHGF